MLIGICGGICSGKKTVAQYLVDHHAFKHLHLRHDEAGSELTRSSTLRGHVSPQVAEALSMAVIPDTLASTNGSLSDADSGSAPSQRQPEDDFFATPEAVLDFVTRHWRGRFVMTDIPTEAVLDVFSRRPFFLLLSIDAPVMVRWSRCKARASQAGGSLDISLEEFVRKSDGHLYDPHHGFKPLISRATVRLLNTSSSLAHLYATLGKLDILNPDRLRPGWDTYFMTLASLAAQRSNCMKRRVGCVLVGKERRVISTGYNGTPRGIRNCADGGCPRCNQGHGAGVGLATCLCIHAEENALLEAGRERIREDSILYCDTCPCLTCSIKICQVGISEVVYAQGYSMDKEAAAVFSQAGVRLRQFVPPPNGLIHLEKMNT